MAFKLLLRQQHAPHFIAGTLAAGALLLPHSTVHAEVPPEEYVWALAPPYPQLTDRLLWIARKPIYDDLALVRKPTKSFPPPKDQSSTRSPTPTDRLADQIGRVRKFIYAHNLTAENHFNAFMSSALHQEKAFTQTIASLAPPPESHERVMPGALYVLVAAMTGSIISRNRNILLRASVPLAIGLGTAWAVLPVTTRNVGDLVWTYEEKAPLIAENHMRIRGAVEEGWRQAKRRGEVTKEWSNERVRESREAIESWVRKGK